MLLFARLSWLDNKQLASQVNLTRTLNYTCLQQFQGNTFFFFERSWVICRNLLNVTQQGDTAQNPVIWILIGFQVHTCNIRQICSPWFLVYRALVHPRISASGRVNSVDMNDRHGCEENLLSGFHKFAASAIPPGSVKIQSMHIDPFSWGLSDVIFKETRDVIMKHHAVQGPALVRTRHFLKNRKPSYA